MKCDAAIHSGFCIDSAIALMIAMCPHAMAYVR
jgi:hypothetical protein